LSGFWGTSPFLQPTIRKVSAAMRNIHDCLKGMDDFMV